MNIAPISRTQNRPQNTNFGAARVPKNTDISNLMHIYSPLKPASNFIWEVTHNHGYDADGLEISRKSHEVFQDLIKNGDVILTEKEVNECYEARSKGIEKTPLTIKPGFEKFLEIVNKGKENVLTKKQYKALLERTKPARTKLTEATKELTGILNEVFK